MIHKYIDLTVSFKDIMLSYRFARYLLKLTARPISVCIILGPSNFISKSAVHSTSWYSHFFGGGLGWYSICHADLTNNDPGMELQAWKTMLLKLILGPQNWISGTRNIYLHVCNLLAESQKYSILTDLKILLRNKNQSIDLKSGISGVKGLQMKGLETKKNDLKRGVLRMVHTPTTSYC